MMKRVGLTFFSVIIIVAIGAFLSLHSDDNSPKTDSDRTISVSSALGDQQDRGFARALKPRTFLFPRDHGPHPEFQTEWWYFTGNLETTDRRHFGYQLTFFRSALMPRPSSRDSAWATNQVYMAHFALTDTTSQQFHHFERFSRSAKNLAGAAAEPFRVWLEDWFAKGGISVTLPITLSAKEERIGINLELDSSKPIVLQGMDGLSQKSSEPGNASYYYSFTRMPTVGRIQVGEDTFEVSGHSWLDREWSTSALGKNQVGWDWFSFQFDDGREMMYYQLRLQDGTPDPLSRGMLVSGEGETESISPHQIQIDVLERWTSRQTGSIYPSKWRLRLDEKELVLEVTPRLPQQEIDATFRYWEGAVTINGRFSGGTIEGSGYIEMTGY